MRSVRRSLPSLGALVLFEAAARLESFTGAAGELGVTQAAVSRQVKALERDLGVALFTRGHRRVTLTPAGQVLASATAGAFGQIADALDAVRQLAAPDQVTVGVTPAFTHFWLMPRLPAFRAAHPGVKLRLVAEDADVDLRRARRDVAVRYGLPPFEDGRSVASGADEVFPVCSPALAGRLAERSGGVSPNLAALPLIESDWANPSWLTWQDWLSRVGLGGAPIACDLRFNHYADSVYAALDGAGVVLGWRRLVGDLLEQGRLVRLGDRALVPPERYHVLLPQDRDPSGPATRFADWLADSLLRQDA